MTRLYVGNLPWTTTEQELSAVFLRQGLKPGEVAILTNRETGQSRGYGADLGGRQLRVSIARPRERRAA